MTMESSVPSNNGYRHACIGRAQRLATKDQRHALRSMYRTYGVGDCNTAFDRCEIHHSLEWTAQQGPTDLEYLFPVCSHHHHRLHEGRWRTQLDASTRELTVTYPDGTLHSRTRPDLLDDGHSAAKASAA